MRTTLLMLPLLLLGSPYTHQAYAQSRVVAEGAAPRLLLNDCQFTEGPASDPQGIVYFTDQPNDRILKVNLDESISEFLKPAGRSNGMFFSPEGTLIACADEKHEMWEIDSDGHHRVLFSEYQGKKLNGPNDVWLHPNGSMFFTDPYYKRPWWNERTMPQDGQHVYSANRDGSNITRLPDPFKQPNGIVGDPLRLRLYVADIGDHKTYYYSMDSNGKLSGRTLFCHEGSDGMTVDRDGNVYLTGKEGVMVYDPQGQNRELIPIDRPWTANVCFGGPNHQTLFITASHSLYAVTMKVQGF